MIQVNSINTPGGKAMDYSSITSSHIAGGIFGLAVGDAAGVPFEGLPRSDFKWNTVPRYRFKGFGVHNQPPGTWSDDTSMTMCLVQSIIDMNGKISPKDIMNKFMDWYYNAKYTATGSVFDCGRICQHAIESWRYQLPIEMCARKDSRSQMETAPLCVSFRLPFCLRVKRAFAN